MKIIFKLGGDMKSRESYNTKQKDIIVETIKKHNDEFIVKDIYEELNR